MKENEKPVDCYYNLALWSPVMIATQFWGFNII